MSGWRPALAALLAWAVHFFVAYGLMLAAPNAPLVAWATLGLGLLGLAFLGLLLHRTPRHAVVKPAALLAGVGIVWQSIAGLF